MLICLQGDCIKLDSENPINVFVYLTFYIVANIDVIS